MAATIDIPHIDQHYGTIRSRTIESTISPPTKTAIITIELVEGRVAIMKRRLHYDMNKSINPQCNGNELARPPKKRQRRH